MDTLLEEYLEFAERNPAVFVNASEGGIEILLDEEVIREVEEMMGRKLEAKGLPREWARVGIVYRDQYMTMVRDAVRFPDGRLGTYIRVVQEEGSAAGVVVFPMWEGKIVLLKHFRHATRDWHWEIPRGFGERGYTNEENARRELEEEMGGVVRRIVGLGTIAPGTGLYAEMDELFFVELERYGEPERGDGIAEIVAVSVLEFRRMVRANEIVDGFTLAAYGRAVAHGLL